MQADNGLDSGQGGDKYADGSAGMWTGFGVFQWLKATKQWPCLGYLPKSPLGARIDPSGQSYVRPVDLPGPLQRHDIIGRFLK